MPHSVFDAALASLNSRGDGRRWLFVPYDQLNDGMGPLRTQPPEELGIVMIETRWKPRQRPYHKQKLALVVANQRHFALEQARRGVAVRYLRSDASYGVVLKELRASLGDIACMQPAERELRVNIADSVTFLPHEGWLTQAEDFSQQKGPPWRMDVFYRFVRRKTGYLMDSNAPRGGRWSFDADNRKPYRGSPPLPTPHAYTPDAITREVGELIATQYAEHPGTLNLSTLPATRADAQAQWDWAKKACLPHFGPFEDAMTTASTNLFHTRLSPLLNMHRLLPRDIIDEAVTLPIDLASLEGFVRQILGWREFMHHIHVATDGLRTLSEHNVLQANSPVPAAFWGQASGLHCLDTVVQSVWQEGYSHHITRLMILCNIGNLLGIDPRSMTDWFWVAYIDAYDWVMDTNGMGMGLYALGDVMTTKPYVSGAAYIHRMSDYCKECAFDPKRNCPITPMYWAFLARHEKLLSKNLRMQPVMNGVRRRAETKKREDADVTDWVKKTLARGARLTPDDLPVALHRT